VENSDIRHGPQETDTSGHVTDFRGARSKLEAVARISSLTDSPPETLGPGSKERKSALVNLANGLGLMVDTDASKPELAAQIALALNVPWDQTCWSSGQTITLDGLNAILAGAERRLARRKTAPQPALFEPAQTPTPGFVPSLSKLEAVARISALTHSPPETLGPGSKERKSVLVNLANGLGLTVDTDASKPELAAQIALALNVIWDQTCWSSGQTITLVGLNILLAGAQVRLGAAARVEGGIFHSADSEARALITALSTAVPHHLDGRNCIAEMQSAGYSHWAQDEWVAFYFEFVGLPVLINTFGGGPRTFQNTRFDYGLGHTWDLKVHMAHSGVAPLNDCLAIDAALAAGTGVGFMVLTGEVKYDDGDFRQWQRDFREAYGKKAKKRATPPTYNRKSKPTFRPVMIEAFYLEDETALATARSAGETGVMKQGVQASGKRRPPKYVINLAKARLGPLLVSGVAL
jgi:hypothetical protein